MQSSPRRGAAEPTLHIVHPWRRDHFVMASAAVPPTPSGRLGVTIVDPTVASGSIDPLDVARRLAAIAAELAPEAELRRELSEPLVGALADAGMFRLCVPTAVGGLQAHPATLTAVVEALAVGDAAAAWCVAVSATSGLLAGYLPTESARAIYAGPRAMVAGVFAPKGRAMTEQGGYRASGRWPFASGCRHADWLMGGCVVTDGDTPRMLPNGMPEVHLLLAPSEAFTIHDTWHVMGLRATGSHDIELAGVHVPRERSASVFSDPPVDAGPLYAFPLFGLLALAISAVCLGIARGALDDLVALAGGKVPTSGRRTLAERSTVQAEVARAEAAVRAAGALLDETIGEAWERAVAHGSVDARCRAGLRLAATHATAAGVQATETAYRLAGGSAIHDSNPLQRRLRDVQVAAQHMLVAPATWELSGRLLLGLPTDVTQL
jgi:alkylation response protein AidB-like acyl-CoA dehydrogenase